MPSSHSLYRKERHSREAHKPALARCEHVTMSPAGAAHCASDARRYRVDCHATHQEAACHPSRGRIDVPRERSSGNRRCCFGRGPACGVQGFNELKLNS